MKKIVALALVLAMGLAMAGCGCAHEDTQSKLIAVDTAALTAQWEVICTQCGEVMETTESGTGIAPADGVIAVSPDEWQNCLLTNIQTYGAGQILYSYPVESQDGTLLHSLVTMSQMNAVFSYQDTDGNTLTTDSKETRGSIHNIRIDAQFTNDNAQEFFMLLMLVLINNNSSLEPADANTLAGQIMSGTEVTDNGYSYAMEILSVEDHTVCVSITAE